ncbi:hypothetical protein J5N97_013414 [Dioscorea zingiberensis]|uniref:Uncharacterized protein n=1 Tax=Dioscorea zingiberensis TaxID=325984 RepID=A0A9D5HIL8_9LILI|nr:hypothetical protein J5N97_013414 [Dioscorea zingiberensis]
MFRVTTLFNKTNDMEKLSTINDREAINIEIVKAVIKEKSDKIEEMKRSNNNKEVLLAALQDLQKHTYQCLSGFTLKAMPVVSVVFIRWGRSGHFGIEVAWVLGGGLVPDEIYKEGLMTTEEETRGTGRSQHWRGWIRRKCSEIFRSNNLNMILPSILKSKNLNLFCELIVLLSMGT